MSDKTKKILVATTNPGKFAELKDMLDFGFEWCSLGDLSDVEQIREDGLTFVENARKKAFGYAKASGCWTIADDSGLVVDALGGAPGVRSSRFSGAQEIDRILLDHKNMAKVLRLLSAVPNAKRTAKFVCCLCLASPKETLIETEGKLEGLIAQREIGENGFGYDPIFFVPELNKTVAQLTADEKNAISHRGQAIRKLRPLLEQILRAG
ncbi:MAG: RdgB/HAM1 family non-canonical purine NTP pyrophosphatase [Sedimentisphaerales bacterium]|nr:RdgB/HAM1 family non-canonical purine NTP pyrophosphatase [Sedimentisphaerales bacterium]